VVVGMVVGEFAASCDSRQGGAITELDLGNIRRWNNQYSSLGSITVNTSTTICCCLLRLVSP